MLQNLRLDIIYYMTSSDFEMEFNLNGCCRMRLLSNKTDSKKSFVTALARAVSRSRIIIACGPLFSDDGLIKTVATAINAGTAVCDNKTFGINSDDVIEIINGSLPLVTADGYFGGCIIESGPQTIILLTENKAFRKSIMQNLIHPYIEEMSYISEGGKATADTQTECMPETVEVTDAAPYITESDEEYAQEPEEPEAELAADEHNIHFVMDGEEPTDDAEQDLSAETATETQTDFDKMYTEVEPESEIKSRYENAYVPSQTDNMFLTVSEPDEDLQKLQKHKGGGINIAIVVLVLILLFAILALCYFVFLKPMMMGVSVGEYLNSLFTTST